MKYAAISEGRCVGYHKKGYPKQKPKNGSDPKQKLARQTGSQPKSPIRPRPPRRGPFARGPLAEASEVVPILRFARGLLVEVCNSPVRPRPPRRGLQFSDSPEAPSPLTSGDPLPKASADPLSSQASAGPPTLRLARGGHGSTPLPLPPPVPLTKRRVALTQPTAAPDNSRMLGTVQQND